MRAIVLLCVLCVVVVALEWDMQFGGNENGEAVYFVEHASLCGAVSSVSWANSSVVVCWTPTAQKSKSVLSVLSLDGATLRNEMVVDEPLNDFAKRHDWVGGVSSNKAVFMHTLQSEQKLSLPSQGFQMRRCAFDRRDRLLAVGQVSATDASAVLVRADREAAAAAVWRAPTMQRNASLRSVVMGGVCAYSDGRAAVVGAKYTAPNMGKLVVERCSDSGVWDDAFAAALSSSEEDAANQHGLEMGLDCVVRAEDQELLIVGTAAAGGFVARLQTTGKFNVSFGVRGAIVEPRVHTFRAVVSLPDDLIVAVGDRGNRVFLAIYQAGKLVGLLNHAFGSNMDAVFARSVVLDGTGGAVLVGEVSFGERREVAAMRVLLPGYLRCPISDSCICNTKTQRCVVHGSGKVVISGDFNVADSQYLFDGDVDFAESANVHIGAAGRIMGRNRLMFDGTLHFTVLHPGRHLIANVSHRTGHLSGTFRKVQLVFTAASDTPPPCNRFTPVQTILGTRFYLIVDTIPIDDCQSTGGLTPDAASAIVIGAMFVTGVVALFGIWLHKKRTRDQRVQSMGQVSKDFGRFGRL